MISEGLGLLAEALAFPGDEAQRWLTDNVLVEFGMQLDGTDLAAVHEARNVFWGVWGIALFMIAEGRSDREVRAHLSRRALLSEDVLATPGPELNIFKTPFAEPYIFGYYHGWRLLRSWRQSDRRRHLRRLLPDRTRVAEPR